MELNVGEKYTFKITKGRGRPFVGQVIKKMGIFTILQMKDGQEVRVSTKNVIRKYEFKPYNKNTL